MTRRENSLTPPSVMTWTKASPFIIVAMGFDVARGFFYFFWLFGPVLAAGVCTGFVNGAVGTSIANTGGKVVTAGCALAAGAVGTYFGPSLAVASTFLAMMTGLLGWLVVWTALAMNNPRVFTQNSKALYRLLVGFGLSELPFVGALPALSTSVWRLFHIQIKEDHKALVAWQQANAERLRLVQEHIALAEMQARAEEEAFEEEQFLAEQERIEEAEAEEEIQDLEERLAAAEDNPEVADELATQREQRARERARREVMDSEIP